MFGLRSHTFPSNLHDVTKYEIITITDIPCKWFTDYPPRNFRKFWEFPKNPNDVVTSAKYLSKIEVGEFYKTAKLEHFISNGLVTDGVQISKFEEEFPGILM